MSVHTKVIGYANIPTETFIPKIVVIFVPNKFASRSAEINTPRSIIVFFSIEFISQLFLWIVFMLFCIMGA